MTPEKLAELRTKVLPVVAYSGLFIVAFFLFCYWSFPYDRVSTYLVDQVARSGKGYTLEVGELSPYWLSGVELTDVTLRKPEPVVSLPPGVKKAPAPSGIKVRELRARLGLFALLFGSKKVNFDAALEGGELEGSVVADEDNKQLKATFNNVDLGKLGAFETLVSVPAKGALNGDIDLSIDKDPKKTTGTVKLVLTGLVIGDGKAKVKLGSMGGLTVDPIEAGNVTIELDVKNGIGTVQKITADGKDLELRGSGDVRFADPVVRSRISILMAVKFTDSYRNKSSRTKAMFSLLDSGMPEVNAAKAPDGALQFRLVGTLSSIRALPQGAAKAAARSGPAPSAPGDDEE